MTVTIQATDRKTHKRSELRQLRQNGMIPASVSGKKISPVSIAIDEKEFLQLLRGHKHEIMEMDVPGLGKQSVILKDIQVDKMHGGKLLHVDFHQISMSDPVRTTVAITFIGEPAGGEGGAMLQQLLTELEVRALPKDLPSAIEVDVSKLGIGDKLQVDELMIPANVECLTDSTALVATVLQVRQPTEEEQEEMVSEAEDKGGLKESSGVKRSDRPNVEDAAQETAGANA